MAEVGARPCVAQWLCFMCQTQDVGERPAFVLWYDEAVEYDS